MHVSAKGFTLFQWSTGGSHMPGCSEKTEEEDCKPVNMDVNNTGLIILSKLVFQEMHWTHLLDLRGTRCTFWWVTLNVTTTFVCLQEIFTGHLFKFCQYTFRSATKAPEAVPVALIGLKLVFACLWYLPSLNARLSWDDYWIMCDGMLVSPTKNMDLSPPRKTLVTDKSNTFTDRAARKVFSIQVIHHSHSFYTVHVVVLGESSADDWEGCRRQSD